MRNIVSWMSQFRWRGSGGRGWHEIQSGDGVTDGKSFPGDGELRSRRGYPGAQREYDGLFDGTGNTRALRRHGVHESRVVVENARRPAASAGQLVTQTARSDSPESPLMDGDAALRCVRRPDRRVLHAQAFAVFKLASNCACFGRKRKRRGD